MSGIQNVAPCSTLAETALMLGEGGVTRELLSASKFRTRTDSQPRPASLIRPLLKSQYLVTGGVRLKRHRLG